MFLSLLGFARYEFTRHNCNLKAKELFDEYCEHFQVNSKDFKGVELTDFPQRKPFMKPNYLCCF